MNNGLKIIWNSESEIIWISTIVEVMASETRFGFLNKMPSETNSCSKEYCKMRRKWTEQKNTIMPIENEDISNRNWDIF